MCFDEVYLGNVFIGSYFVFEESEVVFYGMLMDWIVSYCLGLWFGLICICEVLIGLEEYSLYLDWELEEVKYFDVGDILFLFGNF